MIADLLDLCFPDGLPPRWTALLDLDLAEQLIADYKLNPVVCFGAARPPRLAYSSQGEVDEWLKRVSSLWSHPDLAEFLTLAAPNARRMVDSAGSRAAVVYLDDLQDTGHAIASDCTLLCACLHLPSGTRSLITRHVEPPIQRLPPIWQERLQTLLDLGAVGLWGIRTRGDEVESLLWVTESRWRRNAAATNALVEGLSPPPLWHAIHGVARRNGVLAYPDAVELRADGSLDVTAGFLRVE